MGNPLYSTPPATRGTHGGTHRPRASRWQRRLTWAIAGTPEPSCSPSTVPIPVGGGPEAPPQASLGRSFPVLSGVQAGGHLQSVVGRISWIREAVKGPMLLRRKSRPGHTERAIFTCPGRYRQPRQKPGGPILSKHVLPVPFTPGWSRQGGQLRGRWVPPAAPRDGRGLGAAPAAPTKLKGLPSKSRGTAEDGDASKKPAAEGLKGPVWGQLPSRRPRPNSFV